MAIAGKERDICWRPRGQAARQEVTNMMTRVFLEHPRSVDESYLQHAGFALRFAGRLFAAAFAALAHALIPVLFERTASRAVADLYALTSGRGS